MSLHPKRTLLLTCIFLLSFGNRYEVIVSASEQQNTHQISFNDCSDSRIVHRLSTDGACQAPPVSNKTRGEYQLLQEIGYQTVDGWSCEIRHSTFEFYCGVYSHLKLIKIPDIEISLPVTPGECRKFVNQHKYRTKNGGSHVLNIPGETILQVNDLGVLHPSGTVSCQGQDAKIDNEIVERVLILSQYRITIRKESFKLQQGKMVESITQHLRLPKGCRPKQGMCEMAERTFIWNPSSTRCNLERIQRLSTEEVGNYLIDHKRKVLIQRLSQVPAPAGCGNVPIWSTPYPELFIAGDEAKFPEFSDNPAIHVEAFARGLSDYVLWRAEEKLAESIRDTEQITCSQRLLFNDRGHHHLQDNLYGTRRGDIIYVYKCAKKVADLVPGEQCFKDIQVANNGEVLFVDPVTRLAKKSSPPVACSTQFPLEVKTTSGQFLKITPTFVRSAVPEKQQLEDLSFSHESLSSAGFYTSTEFAEYRQLTEESAYHDALTYSLLYGDQVQKGLIPGSPTMAYDFGKLTTVPNFIDQFDLIKRVDTFVERAGGYLALIVILLEIGKLFLTLGMLAYTCIQEGRFAMLGLLRVLCCSTVHTTLKTNTKARRSRDVSYRRGRRDEPSTHYEEPLVERIRTSHRSSRRESEVVVDESNL